MINDTQVETNINNSLEATDETDSNISKAETLPIPSTKIILVEPGQIRKRGPATAKQRASLDAGRTKRIMDHQQKKLEAAKKMVEASRESEKPVVAIAPLPEKPLELAVPVTAPPAAESSTSVAAVKEKKRKRAPPPPSSSEEDSSESDSSDCPTPPPKKTKKHKESTTIVNAAPIRLPPRIVFY